MEAKELYDFPPKHISSQYDYEIRVAEVSKTFETKSSKKVKLLNHKLKKYDSNYIAKKTFFTIFIRLISILIVASLVNLYG